MKIVRMLKQPSTLIPVLIALAGAALLYFMSGSPEIKTTVTAYWLPVIIICTGNISFMLWQMFGRKKA